MSKKDKTIVPVPLKTWHVVATKEDIKWESIPYLELMQWVMSNVPSGTLLEDINISVDVDTTTGYYDDVIVNVSMKLSVLK